MLKKKIKMLICVSMVCSTFVTVDLLGLNHTYAEASNTGTSVASATQEPTTDSSQGINITNTTLKSKLGQAAGKGSDYTGDLTAVDLASIKGEVDLSNSNITDSDMAVMKYLTGVTSINLSNNTAITYAGFDQKYFDWTTAKSLNFSGCKGIVYSVDNMASLSTRGQFYNCGNLKSIVLPENITNIMPSMFDGCTGLTSITIPTKTLIGTSAFMGCTNLANVTLQDGVTGIGSRSFMSCPSLKYIKLPGNINQSGLQDSFTGDTGLVIDARGTTLTSAYEDRWGDITGLTYLYGQDGKLSSSTLSLKTGEAQTITSEIPSDKTITWGSTDTSVVTVSDKGEVTGVKPGTAYVYAKASDSTYSGLCSVTVTQGTLVTKVTKIDLDKTSASLKEGDTLQLTPTITPKDATNQKVNWTSSDTSIATVDANGKVTAVKAGTADITAASDDNKDITTKCSITVTSASQSGDYISTINGLIDGISPTFETRTDDAWHMFDLIKAGKAIPESYLTDQENKIKQDPNYLLTGSGDYVKDDIQKCEGITLTVIAAGKDPTNFGGINLIEKIYDSKTLSQDIMGLGNEVNWAYALITLNSGKFNVPDTAPWTRANLIQKLLSKQKSDGGWNTNSWPPTIGSMSSTTAIVMTALAPYYSTNADVKTALDKAIQLLENRQTPDGGFDATSNASSNTSMTASTIMGLCAMGIDPVTDSRFVKNGKNPVDVLLSSAASDKTGFMYNGYNDPGTTAAGFTGITAYKLFKEGKGSMYNFVPQDATVTKVTKIDLDKTSASVEKGSTVQLTATVAPEDATNKNMKWTSDKTDIAAVDNTGKVTGLAAGTATITATTEDGGKTASCTVTVTDNSKEDKSMQITTDLAKGTTFKLGNDAKISINVKNNSTETQEASLILSLFNKDNNKFISCVSAHKNIPVGDSADLTGSMKLPTQGNYEIRAFVWNNLDDMKPISDVITIPISDTGK
ncbi:Ig-like domain-containing protein [Clostridium sp. 001]|uniref:Ig-like domain-containing protein n=1 Tax=Clostridium sp. 001 TaxID=1970093 RepID=UPI001C2C5537|nr:Ig-like domain-containing protein [Clostridium sp. 001]QXE17561.1 hypothetical protein B5S50_01130 [Clostridium sp. 001]